MNSAIAARRTSRALLDRILEQPNLVEAIQSLDGRALAKLVDRVGLEDAGEIVALATCEQLERVFDEALWRSEKPGVDERFDADRFALWVEVLVEQGSEFAARKLAELDEDLVTLGLCKHLFVIDIEQLAQRMSNANRCFADDELDKQLESGLYHEFEQYRVISRSQRGWDAILEVFAELNTHDFATLSRLLERCCDISTEYIEDNGGLYQVLTSEQVVEADVAAEREQRREAAGYVPASAALSFLKLTLSTPLEVLIEARDSDPVTRAHFRVVTFEPSAAPASVEPDRQAAQLGQLLESMGDDVRPLSADQSKALSTGKPIEGGLLLSRAMGRLRERDPQIYTDRALQLGYLANLLLSGCGIRERRLRPVEAVKTALAVCDLGAEHLSDAKTKNESERVTELVDRLHTTDLVKLFQIGLRLTCETDPQGFSLEQSALGRLRALLRLQGLIAS